MKVSLFELLYPLRDDGFVVLSKAQILDLTKHEIWCGDAEAKLRDSCKQHGLAGKRLSVFNLPRRIIVIDELAGK